MTLTGKILGDDSTVIRLTRADCMSGLTRDEKGLVGSLGLGRPISLVIERSDLPAPVVRCLLASLYERGVITVVQPPANASSRRMPTRPDRPQPHTAVRLEPACPQPAEDSDLATLDAETRREFRELESRLSSPDHFYVLNLPRTADPAAVKQRYYDLCRRLHPDRFAGAAASLSLRAERLFARLSAPDLGPDLNWKTRHRSHGERMAEGDIFALCEVVKELAALSDLRPLPAKERELYDSARHLLIGELAAALEIDEASAEDAIDFALFPPGVERRKLAAMALDALADLAGEDDLDLDADILADADSLDVLDMDAGDEALSGEDREGPLVMDELSGGETPV